MATIYIKYDNISCWVGKVKNRLVQGRKWSLILVALMKCLFLNVKEVALAVSTKPVVTLRALSCDGSRAPVVCTLGSELTLCLVPYRPVGAGGTSLQGVESAAGMGVGAHLVVNRARWARLGVVMVCGFLQNVQEYLAWLLWC